jgi:hypothetical protein
MVLTDEQQRRKEVQHQLALIRQVGSKTKEDVTQNINMVYDTVADAKRDVEAKVHEKVEKMMTEYYKSGAQLTWHFQSRRLGRLRLLLCFCRCSKADAAIAVHAKYNHQYSRLIAEPRPSASKS